MFGLVSKKKYRELEEKYLRLEKQAKEKRREELDRLIEKNNDWTNWATVLKQNVTLAIELLKYKQKYADELQKRLELAERVKELEEGAGKDGEGAH